jgi:Transposase
MLDERWYRCLEVGGWHYLVQGTGTGDTSIIRRAHREGVLDAVRLGLSNGRLEGLNSKVRLISHRSFGLHSAAALIALVYLCCGGIEVDLPLS